jgi:hypothetical protein
MTVIILIAALAIDVSSWYTKHHQAQVVADSAALAAANYMSTTPNASPATAVVQATTYAADNGLAVDPGNVNVNTGNETVTVTPETTGPLLFAGIALTSPPAISARAVAAWFGAECTSGGSGCAFAYAADNVCGSTTGVSGLGGTQSTPNSPTPIDNGVTINKSGVGSGVAVTGDVISASNITTYTNGNQGNWPSVARYPGIVNGTSTGCTGPAPTNPSPYSSAVNNQSVASSYPVDYRNIYSACGNTSTKFLPSPVTCSGGFPEYCSVDITGTTPYTVGTYVANAIYCDAGSSSNTGDPSTWNGTINVAPQGNATYIAGTVNISFASNSNVGPASGTYGTNLLAYGADCNASRPTTCPIGQTTTTTSPAVNLTGSGTGSITGDFFAPAGVIDDSLSGNAPLTGFLEGWDAVYNANGTVTGQGPPVSSTATFLPDWLAQ